MNIFYLDSDPKLAAQYHCDKHVVKMCLEYAQLLSTALRVNNPEMCSENLYKSTHINHPCAVWARKSFDNFEFLCELIGELGEEYTIRYGKIHKSVQLVDDWLVTPNNFPEKGFTEPPQCMPDEYKSNNTIESYRTYYLCDKKRFATWKTQPPYWWTD